jgi:hypothetical protein
MQKDVSILKPTQFIFCALITAAYLPHAAHAATLNHPVPVLPKFQLADPLGKKFTDAAISERGAVLIVTIPNVKHGPLQDRWARLLTASGWKKDGPRLVFIEDLSQSAVKPQSLESLKKRYAPGKNPLILIDSDGAVRPKFGVLEDETVIFVIDRKGRVVHFTEGEVDEAQIKPILDAASKL